MSELPPEFAWSDPPPPEGNKGRKTWVSAAVAALQEQPGVWAKVRSYSTWGAAAGARDRIIRKGCEAVNRKNDDGIDLYARWPEEIE